MAVAWVVFFFFHNAAHNESEGSGRDFVSGCRDGADQSTHRWLDLSLPGGGRQGKTRKVRQRVAKRVFIRMAKGKGSVILRVGGGGRRVGPGWIRR